MSDKKFGLGDGLLVGAGFSLGYILMRWFLTLVFFACVIGSILTFCIVRDVKENGGTLFSKVVFKKPCSIKSQPKHRASFLGDITVGRVYDEADRKGSWTRILLDDGFSTGWTRCPRK